MRLSHLDIEQMLKVAALFKNILCALFPMNREEMPEW